MRAVRRKGRTTLNIMSRTYRTIIQRPYGPKWLRKPRHKGRLLAGVPRKQVVTNYDDKPIAALRERRAKPLGMRTASKRAI